MSFKEAIATLNRFLSTRPLMDLPSKTPAPAPPPLPHHYPDVNIRGLPSQISRFNLLSKFTKVLELDESLSQLNVIHVAGTKGKGSTCAFTEHILRSSGYRTGLFTSPHLLDIRERFSFNGNLVSEEIFTKHFWWCWNRLEDMRNECVCLNLPFFFPFLTFLALRMFTEENVDVAILEAGLGGRYDATNVIQNPVVCGITSLGFDHMEVLGNTLAEIAYHKAGIFKAGVPAISVPQTPEAMEVLHEQSRILSASFRIAPALESYQLDSIKLGLDGEHQYINAALAVALCSTFEKKLQSSAHLAMLEAGDLPKEYLHGLATTSWPGRGQVIHCNTLNKEITDGDHEIGRLDFYLDGAHTAESLEACADWFYAATTKGKLMDGNNVGVLSDGGHVNGPTRTNVRGVVQLQKVLIFNCMPKRNPRSLMESFMKKCKQNGVHISMALFVPQFSSNVLIDLRNVADIYTSALEREPNLSWQRVLQETWESIQMEYNGVAVVKSSLRHLQLKEDVEEGKLGREYKSCVLGPSSVIMPSLPSALNWLRCWALEDPVELQVLVTGSLYLIGDVLKIFEDSKGLELEIKANTTIHIEAHST